MTTAILGVDTDVCKTVHILESIAQVFFSLSSQVAVLQDQMSDVFFFYGNNKFKFIKADELHFFNTSASATVFKESSDVLFAAVSEDVLVPKQT